MPPKDYKLRPELPRVLGVDVAEGADMARWRIDVSAEWTVVELAVLLKGLRCKVEVRHVGDGVFSLHPVDSLTPPPSAEELRDIMSAGLTDPLPTLISRQAT